MTTAIKLRLGGVTLLHGPLAGDEPCRYCGKAKPWGSMEPCPGPREREGLCMSCKQEYPVWYAPNALWNQVMRQSDGSDIMPFVCPTCFAVAAREAGVGGAFVLHADSETIAKSAYEHLDRLWSRGEGPNSFVACMREAIRLALAGRTHTHSEQPSPNQQKASER